HVGELTLPSDGLWSLEDPIEIPAGCEIYLHPNEPGMLRRLGKRMYAALEERQIQSERWNLQGGFEDCRIFAQEHDGRGPKSLTQIYQQRAEANRSTWRWGERATLIRQLRDRFDDDHLEGPCVHLIADVRFDFQPVQTSDDDDQRPVRRTVGRQDRKLLAFQLRPFINDGKHWVLYTDGSTERIEIDQDLLSREGVEIDPVTAGSSVETQRPRIGYELVLKSPGPIPSTIELAAYNQILDQSVAIRWETDRPEVVDADELKPALDRSREFAWKPYQSMGGGGVLSVWRSASAPANGNARRPLSMFSVLGGRAAIEETLQLQNIDVTEDQQTADVDLASIKGVEVTSHPFEEMLGDQPGGELELANFVPADRFFVYAGNPESIPALFDSGAPFIASIGTSLTGNALRYDLVPKYLSRLGLSRDWLDSVLEAGLISELAVFAPDLFFIDGTDVTVVARFQNAEALLVLQRMAGNLDLDSGNVIELPSTNDMPAFFALRDDLLFVSTNRGELELAIDHHETGGKNSLGASTEFRYMLTKLDVSEQTRFYAYLSDPFIRRLTGPAIKIGQRRRMIEKARMESLVAKSMLNRLNGGAPIDASSTNQPSFSRDLSISKLGIVRSERYGSLERMRTLRDLDLEKVTPAEAEAYRIYRENYSRYWRRFFDPIAVRLDEVGDRQLELATFILPLVDNSIYNGLRSMLEDQSSGNPLLVPVVEPTP
ncbi:MAG: hypothetical protein AAGJ83_12100, partial [Planctomycetota bacterium]